MNQKALLIDFWSDFNRGDAMMQIALLKLVNDWPATICLDSGLNEYTRFSSQLDECNKVGKIHYLPAPKASLYFRKPGRTWNLINKLVLMFNPFLLLYFFVLFQCRMHFLLPKSIQKTFSAIQQSEKIIWNGRNFRSNSKLLELFEYFDISSTAIACLLLKKKVYAVGISVWPPKTKAGHAYLQSILKRCELVYPRENKTATELEKMQLTNHKNIPDLSFYYLSKYVERKRHAPCERARIGVVLKDPVKRNSLSISDYVDCIFNLIEHYKNINKKSVEVSLINQAILDNEDNELSNTLLQEKLINSGYIVSNQSTPNPTLKDLNTAYEQCDILFSSRMHGCIMASYIGIPFISIPYDSGAKWNILSDLGNTATIEMEKITSLKTADIPSLFDKAFAYSPTIKINEGSAKIESEFKNMLK